jgi:hypothetical protein
MDDRTLHFEGCPIEQPIGVVVEFRDAQAIRVWNYFEWRSAPEAVGLSLEQASRKAR